MLDALGQAVEAILRGYVAQQNEEFVAADPRHDIGFADDPLQPPGDFDKELADVRR